MILLFSVSALADSPVIVYWAGPCPCPSFPDLHGTDGPALCDTVISILYLGQVDVPHEYIDFVGGSVAWCSMWGGRYVIGLYKCAEGQTPDWVHSGCKKDDLAITISGDTSVEPWHKKSDANHTKTNLTYTATVTNSSGQASPNIPVTIMTDVTQDSGGHVHIDARPKGKLAIPTDPIKDGKETISGNTDSNGVFTFTFGSEEASGKHTITAKCTGCQTPATATVNVEIQGLSLLDRDPLSYTLNGEKSWHPGSHYFSTAAMTKIINLAHKYSHDPAFNHQLLIINDSSLIKGGVFDLGQDWTYTPNGHQGHRIGIVVDVNNYRDGPNSDFEDFAQRCCKIDAVWEGPDITATPHYHLKLLGKDQ